MGISAQGGKPENRTVQKDNFPISFTILKYQLGTIQELCRPFVRSLQLLLDLPDSTYISEMLDAFISGVNQSITRSEIQSVNVAQAILHRVLTIEAGLPTTKDYGPFHTLIVKALTKAKFELCKLSLRELNWGREQGFITLRESFSWTDEEPQIYSSDNPEPLSMNLISTFNSRNKPLSMSLGLLQTSPTNTLEQLEKNFHQRAPLANSTKEIFQASTGYNAVVVNQAVMERNVLPNDQCFQPQSAIYIDCSALITVQVKNRYLEVQLIPGSTILLIKHESPTNENTLSFLSALQANTNKGKCINIFPSHKLAWDYVQRYKTGAIIFTDGMALKKNGNVSILNDFLIAYCKRFGCLLLV